jgi:hypothetical protein
MQLTVMLYFNEAAALLKESHDVKKWLRNV